MAKAQVKKQGEEHDPSLEGETCERARAVIVTKARQPAKPCENPVGSCEAATLKATMIAPSLIPKLALVVTTTRSMSGVAPNMHD